MLPLLAGSTWYKETLSHRLLFGTAAQASSLVLAGGVPPYPISYARAPNGYVYFTNGLMPLMKWNGVRNEAVPAGVPAPTTAPVITGTGLGAITGTYTAYLRFLDEDDNPSDLSPVSNSITLTTASTITYSSVQVPSDSRRVARRQLLRNTAGQASVYYVDIDTTDLTATTFRSTLTDSELGARTAVALFDSRGRSTAGRYAEPRNDKTLIVCFYDRMFAAGDITYSEGHAEVTNGSTTVTGIGTQWVSELAGRYFYVVGSDRPYQISSVNGSSQTLTLAVVYRDATDKFGIYSIRSAPAERQTIYYTEAGFYESWSVTSGLTLEENGDQVTAMMVADSFLFLLQRRHLYRMTFHKDPLVDGGVFISARRGCVNDRSWVYVDGIAYALDEEGIYRFHAANGADPISTPIQDLFWLEHNLGELHVNWEATRWFHAAHSRDEATIRWFVSMSGDRFPRHAICFSYRFEEWWTEEYPFPISCSTLMESVVPRSVLGGPARRIVHQGIGNLDGPNPQAGTTRGTVTSATPDSLSDTATTWPTSGLVGNPVVIYDGLGKGQVRLIASVSGTTMRLTQVWDVQPDTTSKYQLGGIPWTWRSGWFRWLPEEMASPRHVRISFKACPTAGQADLRLYQEYASVPTDAARSWPPTPAEKHGYSVVKDDPDYVIDLTALRGYAQIRLDDGEDPYVESGGEISIELRGMSGFDPVRIHEVTLGGAEE